MIHILSIITYTIIVWLLGSFFAWDISWFLNIGEWQASERFGLMFITLIGSLPFVFIPCFIYEDINENQR